MAMAGWWTKPGAIICGQASASAADTDVSSGGGKGIPSIRQDALVLVGLRESRRFHERWRIRAERREEEKEHEEEEDPKRSRQLQL